MEYEIIHLPKERWKGTIIPIEKSCGFAFLAHLRGIHNIGIMVK